MFKDSIIVLDDKNCIEYVGKNTIEFLRSDLPTPVAYPEGCAEKGDILIAFYNVALLSESEFETLQTFWNFIPKPKTRFFLFVCVIDHKEIFPVRKYIPSDFDFENPIMNIVFEKNSIDIRLDDGTLRINVNNQHLSLDLNEIKELAMLTNNHSIKYCNHTKVGDIVATHIASSKPYSHFLNASLVYGKPASDYIKPHIFEALSQSDVCYITSRGRNICVHKESYITNQLSTVLLFEDKNNLKEIIEKASDEYAFLISGGNNVLSKVPNFNTFRLWGNEKKIRDIERLLQKGSVTNTTILLTGESGTGKTFLAREIHDNSKRSSKPFIQVNCAAIPYTLMESELFGYESGAFTGAKKGGKKGYFELANEGTLFLDEISEIPYTLQGKLLEALQSKSFFRVGGEEKITSDIRVIAATNKDLKELVRTRQFREDLYYRINVFPVAIPSLRERKDALYSIISDILPDICFRLGINPVMISSEAYDKLLKYSWPGNIRELENVLEKAAILSDGDIIFPNDIVINESIAIDSLPVTLKDAREQAEKDVIRRAIELFQGNKERAAEYLGIGRTAIFEKIRKYNITWGHNDDYR